MVFLGDISGISYLPTALLHPSAESPRLNLKIQSRNDGNLFEACVVCVCVRFEATANYSYFNKAVVGP